MVLWRRGSSLIAALRDSASTAASRHRGGGVMPTRIGSWGVGVARRQPETVCRALVRVVSSFCVWALLHQTGAQYLVAEKTSAQVEMCRVLVEAPQIVPARRQIRATRAEVFADGFTRCC